MTDTTARARPAGAPRCAHEHRQEHGPPRVEKAPSSGERASGFVLVQSGVCLDCGFPILRISARVPLGAWETVAGRGPVAGARRVPHGRRYG